MKRIISLLIVITILASALSVFADNADVQEFVIPMVNENAGDDFLAKEDISMLSASGNTLMIDYAVTDDFYTGENIFHIMIGVSDGCLKDLRKKLTLSVIDGSGNTVATQQSVGYNSEYEICYKMKLTKAVSEDNDYSVKFSYNGKYSLSLSEDECIIYPEERPFIKDVKVIDYFDNSYRITLGNFKAGTKYVLNYEYETDVQVTPDASGVVIANFGGEFYQSAEIYLLPAGYEDVWYDAYDSAYLWDFDIEWDTLGSGYEDGFGTDSVVSDNSTHISLYLWNKSFNYSEYQATDVPNIKGYVYDVTTNEIVGNTLTDVEYEEEYGQINAAIKLNKTLNETHKYVVACDDGYNFRINDELEVTSKSKLTSMSLYDSAFNYMQISSVPSGIKSFYVNIGGVNISDYTKASVVLTDSNGKTIANGTHYKNNRYQINTSGLTSGSYKIKATLGTASLTKNVTVINGSESVYQYAGSAYYCNGTTYAYVFMQTSLDPAKLTYSIESEDGTKYSAKFHRLLDDSSSDKMFVISSTAFSEDDVYSSYYVKIYNGSQYVQPQYPNNMNMYIRGTNAYPFVYDSYTLNNEGATFYAEGVSATDSSVYKMTVMDDTTESVKELSMTKKSGAFFVKSADLMSVSKKYSPSSNNYNIDGTAYIEKDGEYLCEVWASELFKGVVADEFSLQKSYIKDSYVSVNLPYKQYAYYRIAKSESELKSKSYQKIATGAICPLASTQGKQTVFAQFKTADGKESAVEKRNVVLDTIAPSFTIVSEVPFEFAMESTGNYFTVELECTVSESGELYAKFYDKDNKQVGNTKIFEPYDGRINGRCYSNGYDYTKAVKMVMYMKDSAGNESPEQTFSISVQKVYETFETDTAEITINTETGIISEIYAYESTIIIPEKLGEIAVKGIGSEAFSYDSNVSVIIPDCITSIANDAFDNLENFTILAKEGSYALEFAQENKYDYTKVVDATEVTLNKYAIELVKGDVEHLTATVLPENAMFKNVEWISSNNAVATVKDGVICAEGEGLATITAKTVNGKISTCSVTVVKPEWTADISVSGGKTNVQVKLPVKNNFYGVVLAALYSGDKVTDVKKVDVESSEFDIQLNGTGETKVIWLKSASSAEPVADYKTN